LSFPFPDRFGQPGPGAPGLRSQSVGGVEGGPAGSVTGGKEKISRKSSFWGIRDKGGNILEWRGLESGRLVLLRGSLASSSLHDEASSWKTERDRDKNIFSLFLSALCASVVDIHRVAKHGPERDRQADRRWPGRGLGVSQKNVRKESVMKRLRREVGIAGVLLLGVLGPLCGQTTGGARRSGRVASGTTLGFSHTTWIVDGQGGGHFLTIQEGIDSQAVRDGDTLQIEPGTYTENLFLGRPLTIRARQQGTVVLRPARNDKDTFQVMQTHSVTIDGLIVHGPTMEVPGSLSAILILGSPGSRVVDTTVTGSLDTGLAVVVSDACELIRVKATFNGASGIFVGTCPGSRLIDCKSHHNLVGIGVSVSPDTVISGCIARDNFAHGGFLGGVGMQVSLSDRTRIEGCRITDNATLGLVFSLSDGGTIRDNLILDNGFEGALVTCGTDNLFCHNRLERNGFSPAGSGSVRGGLRVNNAADRNTFCHNVFRGHTFNSTSAGIFVELDPAFRAEDNLFFLNTFDTNTFHIIDQTGASERNRWDDGKCGNFYQGFVPGPMGQAPGPTGAPTSQCGPVYLSPFVIDSDSRDGAPLVFDPNR
ncbi:MAG: nitrous oxide reductase family maturation protein NosD, partial [Candidatus Binatia bacterium]